MVDLIDLALNEMKARGDFHDELYTPYYPTSYALHAFNLVNQTEKIYYEGKQVPNKRLHIVFVGPPMSSKSYYLEQMSISDNAIFKETGFEMAQKTTMTEAGLCGSFTMQSGSMIKQMGEAEKHKTGFLLIDEFSAIVQAFKQVYNASMEAQLLGALDHGNVNKSLGSGSFSFKTHCSIWAGIQPHKLRMEGDSGLGRRVCFMVNIPDEKQRLDLRKAMFHAQNIKPEECEVENMRNQIAMWKSKLHDLKHIVYDESILDYYIDTNLDPLHQPLAQNIVLGYHLARERWDDSGYLHMDLKDPLLKTMIENSLMWFHDVRSGPDVMQLKKLIKAYGIYSEKQDSWMVPKATLVKFAGSVSMTIRDINDKLGELVKYGVITDSVTPTGNIIAMQG